MSLAGRNLTERLLDAAVELSGVADARQTAVYLCTLITQVIDVADGIAVQAFYPGANQYVTLGTFGYPSFGSTWFIDMDPPLGIARLFADDQPAWAKTRSEVVALWGGEEGDRPARVDRFLAHTQHRSLLFVPVSQRDRRLGNLIVENWTSPTAFTRHDLEDLELVAKVAAVGLAGASVMSVITAAGHTEVIPLGVPAAAEPTSARGTPEVQPVELSPRERDILRLVADGLSTDAIAARLVLSPHTVKTHRRNILARLGCHNTAELLGEARRVGLLS